MLLINLLPSKVEASTLSCSAVDGMSIFGYDSGHYKFIGAIANEYDSNSIANEYGAGSKYDTDSIFNDYGKFGGKYSSFSAFNEYASSPPIIISSDYKFVGYLTIDNYKSPSINTYEGISCAQKSYKSSNKDLEDTTFKEIPQTTSSLSSMLVEARNNQINQAEELIDREIEAKEADRAAQLEYQKTLLEFYEDQKETEQDKLAQLEKEKQELTENYLNSLKNLETLQYTCPANSTLGPDSKCYCKSGLVWGKNSQCITQLDSCRELYGSNMGSAKDNNCYCSDGYVYDGGLKTCVVQEKIDTVFNSTSPEIPAVKNEPAEKPTVVVEKNNLATETTTRAEPKDQTDSELAPSSEISPNPTSVSKIPWYKKIFYWFMGKQD